MSSNITNEDLRSVKTKKALYTTMFALLKSNSFRQITIKGICEEALISRAAFYGHFIDKYDLLKHWLPELWPKDLIKCDAYEKKEKLINNYIQDNIIVIKNLVYEADNETFEILFDFVLSTINLNAEKNSNETEEILQENIVISNFYAGGIISYFLWQIKNNFPAEVPLMNRHLYKIICEFKNMKQLEKK